MSIHELERKSLPELVGLAHDGEANAFTVLTQILNKDISEYVHPRARSRDDEGEIKDDVLLKLDVEVKKHTFKMRAAFFKMLYKVIRHAAVDYYKGKNMYKSQHAFIHNDQRMYWQPDDAPDGLEHMSIEEQKALRHRIFLRAAHELSPQQEQVMLMRIVDEMSYKDIGKELGGLKASQVRAVFCKARANVTEIIKQYIEEAKNKNRKNI